MPTQAIAAGSPCGRLPWRYGCSRSRRGEQRRRGTRLLSSRRRAGVSPPSPRRLVLVRGSSELGDYLGASVLGVAGAPVLAGIAPIRRRASALPTAVRAVEADVVDLRQVSSVIARLARCTTRERRRQARAPVIVPRGHEIGNDPGFRSPRQAKGHVLPSATSRSRSRFTRARLRTWTRSQCARVSSTRLSLKVGARASRVRR
jgi:hypothetical protein